MNRDPFIDSLISSNPNFEKDIYQKFLDENITSSLTDFANTPTWALTALYEKYQATNQYSNMYSSMMKHENFDLAIFDELITENKKEFYSWMVHNPNIGSERLIAISKCNDEIPSMWAKYYLCKDTPEMENLLFAELEKTNADEISFIASYIIRTAKLSDSCVNTIFKKYMDKQINKFKYDQNQTAGKTLSLNPFLTSEQRATLDLMGYPSHIVETPEFPYFPSSTLFPMANSGSKRGQNTDISLLKAIAAEGHPFSAIDEHYEEATVEINELNLFQLIKSEYLHRAFWTELVGVDDFQLCFHNAYRVMDFFISHATLGEEFDSVEYEYGWSVGGVLDGRVDRIWIDKDETIPYDRAVELVTEFGNSFAEIARISASLSDLYAPALAHFFPYETNIDLREKYGVTLTDLAEDVIVGAACVSADHEEFDVEVTLNTNFKENLSWKNLSIPRKEQIFALLECGMQSSKIDLCEDAEHFLGCIALHPATPTSLIKKLEAMGNPLISATLARR